MATVWERIGGFLTAVALVDEGDVKKGDSGLASSFNQPQVLKVMIIFPRLL